MEAPSGIILEQWERVSVDPQNREVLFNFKMRGSTAAISPQEPRLWTRNAHVYADAVAEEWQADTEPEGRATTTLERDFQNAVVVLVIDRSASLKGDEEKVRDAIKALLDQMHAGFMDP